VQRAEQSGLVLIIQMCNAYGTFFLLSTCTASTVRLGEERDAANKATYTELYISDILNMI
jgi:hypothetical protein